MAARNHNGGSGRRFPAEWEPHERSWLAWPHDRSEWGNTLEGAQTTFIELCTALVRSEPLEILVTQPDGRDRLSQLGSDRVHLHAIPTGDLWLRDTGPIFVAEAGGLRAICFGFNGWGGKYVMAHDDRVSEAIAGASGVSPHPVDWIFEGGGIDTDGDGTALTTRECLLNPNRNPAPTEKRVEGVLADALGVRHTIWLDRGLFGDHTDGHVDNVARFVGEARVVCMSPPSGGPNRQPLTDVRDTLRGARDRHGRTLEVIEVPCPEPVHGPDGQLLPASYMNFFIANDIVVVPTYGVPSDARAVELIDALFPGRAAIGIDANNLLAGGGAFHCITQQQPGGVG